MNKYVNENCYGAKLKRVQSKMEWCALQASVAARTAHRERLSCSKRKRNKLRNKDVLPNVRCGER